VTQPEVLTGGNVAGTMVRIGNTVRKPHYSPTVHALPWRATKFG
jgi:hypothetical protein